MEKEILKKLSEIKDELTKIRKILQNTNTEEKPEDKMLNTLMGEIYWNSKE